MPVSRFLPYLCLSSGGTWSTTSALGALRQIRTHTVSEGSVEVHVLYNLQEVIRGVEIKGSVQWENIPPSILPWGQKDGQLPYVDTQTDFILPKAI